MASLPVADPAAKRRIDILRSSHHELTPAAQAFEDVNRRSAKIIAALGDAAKISEEMKLD